MKKILLLGSNGYIGTFLYKNLNKLYDITCVDTCWFNDPPKAFENSPSHILTLECPANKIIISYF